MHDISGVTTCFSIIDGDLVDDAFTKSVYHACGLLIRCNNNKFLILSDEKEFKAQTLTGTQPGEMQQSILLYFSCCSKVLLGKCFSLGSMFGNAPGRLILG